MTTLLQLRTQINNEGISTASNAVWTDTFVNQAINDAIRDYSAHFPRRQTASISFAADEAEKLLPADFISMTRVEMPISEDPRHFRQFLDEADPDFVGNDYAYFMRGSTLVVPDAVSVMTAASVWYSAVHAAVSADSDALTVPDRDLDILIACVKWQAYARILTREEGAPSYDAPFLEHMGLNVDRLRSAYDALIKARKKAGKGKITRWASSLD